MSYAGDEIAAHELQERIASRAEEIVLDSNAGNQKAKRIIDLHRMCVARADTVVMALLDCAFNEWEASKANG